MKEFSTSQKRTFFVRLKGDAIVASEIINVLGVQVRFLEIDIKEDILIVVHSTIVASPYLGFLYCGVPSYNDTIVRTISYNMSTVRFFLLVEILGYCANAESRIVSAY